MSSNLITHSQPPESKREFVASTLIALYTRGESLALQCADKFLSNPNFLSQVVGNTGEKQVRCLFVHLTFVAIVRAFSWDKKASNFPVTTKCFLLFALWILTNQDNVRSSLIGSIDAEYSTKVR